MSTRKLDRWDRIADDIADLLLDVVEEQRNRSDCTKAVRKILRAEHRWVVRIVRELRHKGKGRTAYQSNRAVRCAVISAYTLACDDILDKLERRAR
jgi:hypothetical protein